MPLREPKEMPQRGRQCDPEPFTIVTGIAGIIGGLAGTVSLFKTFAPTSLKRSHRQTIEILRRIIKNLAEMEQYTEQMEKAIATGFELERPPFLLGSRVVLVPLYFSQYAASSDRVMQLLRQLVKDMHRLERRISILSYVNQPDLREVVDLQVKIDDVLHGRNRSAINTLREIRPLIANARGFVENFLRELEHGPVA